MKILKYKLQPIHVFNFRADLISTLENLLKNEKPNLIVTLNLDFLRNIEINQRFSSVCQKADLIIPDGIGVSILLFAKYKKNIKRFTGNEILQIILELQKTHKFKIAIIGSTIESQNKFKEKLLSFRFDLEDFLFISPKYYFEQDKISNIKIIEKIKKFQPSITIAALGSPRQEFWLDENMKQFKSKINVGLGSAIDFYSGFKKRAPRFIQSLGAEWIWRLFQEPKRLFRRYITHDLPYLLFSIKRILFNDEN